MVGCSCLWTGVLPELIDAVSGDPEADGCGDDHQSDPDVGEEADAQLDEVFDSLDAFLLAAGDQAFREPIKLS